MSGDSLFSSAVDNDIFKKYMVSGSGPVVLIKNYFINTPYERKILMSSSGGSGTGGGPLDYLRWQVRDSYYLKVSYRENSRNYSNRNSAGVEINYLDWIVSLNHAKNETERQNVERNYIGLYEPFLSSRISDAALRFQPRAVKEQQHFDIWATAADRYEVFVTEPHRGNKLTREEVHMVRPGKEQAKRLMTGEWTFPFTGPFRVAARGNDRFLVTDAGRVYMAPRDAEPGAPLKEVWKEAPVDVLIHDDDAKKSYAFTRTHYFDVADIIVPKPHNLTIRREWFALAADEQAAKCARVVRGLPEPKAK